MTDRVHIRGHKGGAICGARGRGTQTVNATAIEVYARRPVWRCPHCWRLVLLHLATIEPHRRS